MAKTSKEVTKVTAMEKITKEGITALKKIVGNIAEAKAKADSLQIVDLNDTEGYKAVDEYRKVVKSLRTGVERKRKELNEPALTFQREVNAVAKSITESLTPIEGSLEAKIRVIDQEKEKITLDLARKITERTNYLYKIGMMFNGTGFVCKNIFILPEAIGQYSEEQWQEIIAQADKAIQEGKIEEPIFPIAEPEPEKIVQQSAQDQPAEDVEYPRGSDFQGSDFRHDPPGPVHAEPIQELTPEFKPTVTTFKGLLVNVFKHARTEATLNGASSRHDSMLLIGPGIPEIWTETNPEKVVRLEIMQFGSRGAVTVEGQAVRVKDSHPYVVPMSIDPGTHSMFGGNFIYTSDSRFPSGQPIAIHDRVETGVYDGR